MNLTSDSIQPERLLQQAREARGLSREKLAQRVNMSASTILRMELVGALPKSRALFAIARELDVPLDDIADAALAQPEK